MRYLIAFFCFILPNLSAQNPVESIFKLVEIRTDTITFNSYRHIVLLDGEKNLYFFYNDENEVAEIALTPKSTSHIHEIVLMPSGDYEIIDSLVYFNEAWRCKLRFKNLTGSQFLKLQLKYTGINGDLLEVIRLLPCTQTWVSLKPAGDELFIGEEKIFELITNNPENLRFSGDWTSGLGIDYQIEKQNDKVRLHVFPNEIGVQVLNAAIRTEKPNMEISTNRQLTQLPPLSYTFNVKTSRLKFLNIDRREITLDEKSRTQGIEVQLDNSKILKINKTYRVENQENPGGVLIAEIFTRSFLSNNKVLCYLRTYNYHRSTEGYLYIKDGDEAQFISNFNITPVTSINKISIMRDGADWKSDLSVFPGETFNVKIEGLALYKAKFHFEDLIDLTTDTLIQNDNEVLLKLRVPIDISKKRVNLFNYSTNTGLALTIREYENPRPFDYVLINYGDINRVFSGIQGPVLFEKAIKDVVISFNNNKIDSEDRLYGRQYLTIDVRVTGPNNELVDMKTISNVVVCPSDNSPRYKYYDKRNCAQNEISLNKYLRKSTSDLEDWSKIYLSMKTNPEKYGGESQQKELEIILKKKYKFDIDISFPTGLITVSKDTSGSNSFSKLYGISMAMIAQFSFYHPEKIATLRPYRVGAGFLALNAFNFQSVDQDLAIVALASFYPTTKNRKLAFPLYIGGGYLLKAQKWMMLIGPGISLTL